MSFFQRIVQYLANELIVERLAKTRSFQRWALKTHETVESGKGTAKKSQDTLAQQWKQARDEVSQFAGEVKGEISKELGSKGKP